MNLNSFPGLKTGVPTIITVEWLQSKGACGGAVETFRQYWPDGAEWTRKNLKLAAGRRFDLTWLAEKALTIPARAAYDAADAQAWAAYDAAIAQALWNAISGGAA